MIDSVQNYAFVDIDESTLNIHGHEVINRGGWQGVTTYYRYDGVNYDGEDYIALAVNSSVLPPTDPTKWSILVAVDESEPSNNTGVDSDCRTLAGDAYLIAQNGSNLAYSLFLNGAGNVTADTVYYGRASYETVGAALDAIFYVAPSASLSNSVGTVEIGTTVHTLGLTWSYNKAVVSQSINQGIGSLATSVRTYTLNGTWTSTISWTVTASDGTRNCSSSTTMTFMQKRYWGTNSSTTLSDAQVIALSSEFSSSRNQSRTISPAGQYVYFAWPASYGAATFTVNGLLNTDWVLTQRVFINASGYSESYRIYRSTNLLTGSYIIAVT